MACGSAEVVVGARREVTPLYVSGLFENGDPLLGWQEQVRTTSTTIHCAVGSVGRMTLLGDAWHPMHPFMGQGAAMAIEDGATLVACLRAVEDPAEALQQYERLRLPGVILLQAMSRANKIRFHMPDGLAQQLRDAEWTRSGDRAPDTLRWLYDFDAAAVVPKSA
jgi:2-polyprenyl-6-methoxyphenol hydroxylase-like FAD-dependent oxidoreductase